MCMAGDVGMLELSPQVDWVWASLQNISRESFLCKNLWPIAGRIMQEFILFYAKYITTCKGNVYCM